MHGVHACNVDLLPQVWFMKRMLHERWEPVPAVPRTIKGNENKQRPASQHIPELPQRQEDSCYHTAEMGRISAEMVRPIVTPTTWGGYDVEMLRIASLARLIQIRAGYLHSCSPAYCLKAHAPMCFFVFSRLNPRTPCFK